uniref:Uncharacterized protein n=1 Tax=Anguilla anguilla TaxID=7936 RepID=A0A0E9X330_ANGAN
MSHFSEPISLICFFSAHFTAKLWSQFEFKFVYRKGQNQKFTDFHQKLSGPYLPLQGVRSQMCN